MNKSNLQASRKVIKTACCSLKSWCARPSVTDAFIPQQLLGLQCMEYLSYQIERTIAKILLSVKSFKDK